MEDIYKPFRSALLSKKYRKPILPDEFYAKSEELRPLFFTARHVANKASLVALLDSIADAAGNGISFQEWKKTLYAGGIIPLERVEEAIAAGGRGYFQTVFRNALMTAYASGRWEGQKAAKNAFPYLIYDAVNDNRTRPSHSALDNKVARIDDPIWNRIYPPNGHNCRCVVRSLTKEEAQNGLSSGEYKQFNGDESADDDWNNHGGELQGTREALLKSARGVEEELNKKPAVKKALKRKTTAFTADIQADYMIDFPSFSDAIERGKPIYDKIFGKALLNANVSENPDEIINKLMDASNALINMYSESSGRPISKNAISLFKEIGVLPKRRTNANAKKYDSIRTALSLIPVGLVEWWARADYSRLIKNGESIRYKVMFNGSRGYYDDSKKPPVIQLGSLSKIELINKKIGGKYGYKSIVHEFMHAVQASTYFDEPLMRAVQLDVLKEKRKIKKENDFGFVYAGNGNENGVTNKYMFMVYRLNSALPYSPDNLAFYEVAVIGYEALIFSFVNPAAYVPVLNERELISALIGYIDWADKKWRNRK